MKRSCPAPDNDSRRKSLRLKGGQSQLLPSTSDFCRQSINECLDRITYDQERYNNFVPFVSDQDDPRSKAEAASKTLQEIDELLKDVYKELNEKRRLLRSQNEYLAFAAMGESGSYERGILLSKPILLSAGANRP